MKKATKRLLIGTAIIPAVYLWHERKPILNWFFTRVEVETHPDCKPRYRTWKNGIEQ